MRQLLMTALLAVTAIITNAQDFTNNVGCTLQIRPVCINAGNCTVVSAGSWVSLPTGTTSIPGLPTTCGPNEEPGYEVDYDPSTGCNGTPVLFTSNPATGCAPAAWPPGGSGVLPGCSCNDSGAATTVHFNYDPGSGTISLLAN